MTSLLERVTGYVRLHPGETVDDVARGVRARTAEVRDVLLGDGFSSSLRAAYVGDRALVYQLAFGGRDGSGRAGKPSQCDLIHRVLADGGWHTVKEIHQRCGFSRLNSRVAELRRRRGLNIVCEHIPGTTSGSEAYRYRLVVSEETEDVAAVLPQSLPASVSSGTSAGTTSEEAAADARAAGRVAASSGVPMSSAGSTGLPGGAVHGTSDSDLQLALEAA